MQLVLLTTRRVKTKVMAFDLKIAVLHLLQEVTKGNPGDPSCSKIVHAPVQYVQVDKVVLD